MAQQNKTINVCWLRRDLRLEDNNALYHALNAGLPALVIFIFDTNILDQLSEKKDRRVAFIHQTLKQLNAELQKHGSSLYTFYSSPIAAFEQLCKEFHLNTVFTNNDYEPYAIERDLQIKQYLAQQNVSFQSYKDQVIFEKAEVMKADGTPYTVFTPYSNVWKKKFNEEGLPSFPCGPLMVNLFKTKPFHFPTLKEMGFEEIQTPASELQISADVIRHYHETRNIPSVEGTSFASVHLRFGTISIRKLVKLANELNSSWLNELIWREFFMSILFYFPEVVHHNFKRKYDAIKWRNDEKEFDLWCSGNTGYPMVDAGMRQLNETGWMHNRVRMVVASFLCKHLLIDWQWGEAYFAEKLLDYDLSANNGNWQWASGTGCDSAPYFRIFNPSEQIKKFDPKLIYIKQWIKDFRPGYLPEIVPHEFARKRALAVYKEGLQDQ